MSIVFLSSAVFLFGFVVILSAINLFAITEIYPMLIAIIPTLFFAKSRDDTEHASRLCIMYIIGFCARYFLLTQLGTDGRLLLPLRINDKITLQICGLQHILILFVYYISMYIVSINRCKKALAEVKDAESIKRCNVIIKENSVFNTFTVSLIVNMFVFTFMYELQQFINNMLLFIPIAVVVALAYQIHTVSLISARRQELVVAATDKITPIE